MNIIETILIGREILDGRVTDTNSVFIGDELNKRGLCPRFSQKVDDNIDRIINCFQTAQSRSNTVFVTGGLGPTSDDLTLQAFANFIGKSLSLNSLALEQIQQRFVQINRPFTETQKKQAYFPEGGEILTNPVGTAPGFSYLHNNVQWFFMPGVPKEMKFIFTNEILPKITPSSQHQSYTWYTQFTSEGELQRRLTGAIQKAESQDFELTFRTKFPENHIGLINNKASSSTRPKFQELVTEITQILSDGCFSFGENPSSLESTVLDLCRDSNLDIVTAESCTGGLVASRLTSVPGASQNFWGSFICYDNSAKTQLGVDPKILNQFGAVSENCATELALQAARKKLIASNKPTLALSTTGIAGPSGSTAEKPVGLCFVSAQMWNSNTNCAWSLTEKVQARPGLSRAENILFFSQKCLALAFTGLKNG
jgi:nicotinamide-nucleotide amidase